MNKGPVLPIIRRQRTELDNRTEKAKKVLDEIAQEASKIFGKKVTRGDILGILSGHVKDAKRQAGLLFEKKIINPNNRRIVFSAVSLLGMRLMLHDINLNRRK